MPENGKKLNSFFLIHAPLPIKFLMSGNMAPGGCGGLLNVTIFRVIKKNSGLSGRKT